jgi:hypothetical protein
MEVVILLFFLCESFFDVRKVLKKQKIETDSPARAAAQRVGEGYAQIIGGLKINS